MKRTWVHQIEKQAVLMACFFFLVLKLHGQSAYTFLNVPAHARLAALGGINVSLSDRDVNLFSSNATLAGDTLNDFASLNYQIYLADIGQANFSYQHSFKKLGAVNFGVQHFNYGSIESYDQTGSSLGTFTSGETAFMLGKFYTSNAFRFGVTLKTIFSNLAGFRSSATALDLGGLFIHPKQNLTIGLAIKNLGFIITDFTEGSHTSLPFDVQIGTTFKPAHMPFRFSLTAFDLTDYSSFKASDVEATVLTKVIRHLNIGTELLLSKNVNVLLGYNFRRRQELRIETMGGGAGLSFGFSVQLKSLELVLSRVSYGPRQASYGFTVASNVNKVIRKREKI